MSIEKIQADYIAGFIAGIVQDGDDCQIEVKDGQIYITTSESDAVWTYSQKRLIEEVLRFHTATLESLGNNQQPEKTN